MTESIETFSIPCFKHVKTDIIGQYAAAFRKVAAHAEQLRRQAKPDESRPGRWYFYADPKA